MTPVPYAHAYVHVPFCGRRCSYCDFSIAVRRVVPARGFLADLAAELEIRREQVDITPLRTLYLGGGTPSKLGAELSTVTKVIFDSTATARADALDEFTIEVNPEDVNSEVATAWRRAGVRRTSIGVQSFSQPVLDWMHREHSGAAAESAVRTLRDAGITDLSVDLIYALPDGVERDWEADLEAALALDVPHLSVYGLTFEPATALGKWAARGTVAPPQDERFADEFLRAHERLTSAGYEHYEVSNYARPGHRAQHNSAYWRAVPFLGLGPAAHGFDGTHRRSNIAALAAWERAVRAGTDPVATLEPLDADQRAAERVYLGLRTTDGLSLEPNELAFAGQLVASGWGERLGDRLRLTAEGWLRLDAIAAEWHGRISL